MNENTRFIYIEIDYSSERKCKILNIYVYIDFYSERKYKILNIYIERDF